jgi:ATP-dependent 26S proteasome regulatory subunit
LKPARGILLSGIPGTGKTLIGKVAARQSLKITFLLVFFSSFLTFFFFKC